MLHHSEGAREKEDHLALSAKYPKGCLRQYIHINNCYRHTQVWEKAIHAIHDIEEYCPEFSRF